jgi:hypothetical protein
MDMKHMLRRKVGLACAFFAFQDMEAEGGGPDEGWVVCVPSERRVEDDSIIGYPSGCGVVARGCKWTAGVEVVAARQGVAFKSGFMDGREF